MENEVITEIDDLFDMVGQQLRTAFTGRACMLVVASDSPDGIIFSYLGNVGDSQKAQFLREAADSIEQQGEPSRPLPKQQ